MGDTKRILTVGLTYTAAPIPGVEIDNLGLCRPKVDKDRAAFPLYEYDTIIINPASFTHFLFGKEGEFSSDSNELGKLKGLKDSYDIDSAFDGPDRQRELSAAVAQGANVVWCLAESKRQNFYGHRDTHLGYLDDDIAKMIKQADLLVKKGRRIGATGAGNPFSRYFESLSGTGWTLCLADFDREEYSSIALTPEGYSLGGSVKTRAKSGWIITPPTSEGSANQLIRDCIGLAKGSSVQEKYHGIFLSHTGVDKPFVRQLRDDLKAHGVDRVWIDEAEIDIGDSLISKIDEGMKLCRYVGVVLSTKSIGAPWVKKELDVAMNRELAVGEVVVLPLLYEKCELPTFLHGKLYADFTDPKTYEDVLAKLLRRLRIK